MPEKKADLPIIAFASRETWDAWLETQPAKSKGVWMKLAKRATDIASVSRQEAVETALCHGWIDGQSDKFDQDYWLIRFTPRGPRSKWSEINRTKVIDLIEQGRMKPGGLVEVERAKADGRWDAAYAPPSTATVPDDLVAALDKNDAARLFFGTLDATNRYAILHRIHDAKKPETRARRIETFVGMLSRGETIYPKKRAKDA